jgi:hypothetical protein
MRSVLLGFILALSCMGFSQTLEDTPHLQPKPGVKLDFSSKGALEWRKHDSICNVLWEKDAEKLTEKEQKFLETCSETDLGYYDAVGGGCSWYCAGGQDSLSASSFLQSQKGNTYVADNIGDLSFETAWVEGVDGNGIGEWVSYYFLPQSPRVTEIIIANGYVKSEKAWKENGRVKTLLFSLNGEPVAILELQDVRQEQSFTFSPIGYDRERYTIDELKELEMLVFTFTILEVYPGSKYTDTAISEIYFDGIDVH